MRLHIMFSAVMLVGMGIKWLLTPRTRNNLNKKRNETKNKKMVTKLKKMETKVFICTKTH